MRDKEGAQPAPTLWTFVKDRLTFVCRAELLGVEVDSLMIALRAPHMIILHSDRSLDDDRLAGRGVQSCCVLQMASVAPEIK